MNLNYLNKYSLEQLFFLDIFKHDFYRRSLIDVEDNDLEDIDKIKHLEDKNLAITVLGDSAEKDPVADNVAFN